MAPQEQHQMMLPTSQSAKGTETRTLRRREAGSLHKNPRLQRQTSPDPPSAPYFLQMSPSPEHTEPCAWPRRQRRVVSVQISILLQATCLHCKSLESWQGEMATYLWGWAGSSSSGHTENKPHNVRPRPDQGVWVQIKPLPSLP